MNSRERVQLALAHKEPDHIPFDLGATPTSGVHVSIIYQLRQHFRLDPPGTPVKVTEPYQMLGEIAPDLVEALELDAVPLPGRQTMFGYPNEGWREWQLHDGTPLLVPEGFNTTLEPDGSLLQYPGGDKSVPPSGVMPAGGYFFDAIIRQEPLDESNLDPQANLEEFGPISDQDLAWFKSEAERLKDSGKAVLANFGGTAFGDIALVPAPMLKNPKGVRDVAQWYMVTALQPEFIHEVFDQQCEIALQNLAQIHEVVGEVPTGVFVTGTDFGTQDGTFCSLKTYCDLYQPYHRRINDWIHANTNWKSFIHSCGSVITFIDEFIESGFDILNPVQCSAAGMDPSVLKERFGDRITFWGGGVNTQHTLPFGTPAEVRAEVKDRLKTFGPGGGYVFNAIHNVQARTPLENMLAMIEGWKEARDY